MTRHLWLNLAAPVVTGDALTDTLLQLRLSPLLAEDEDVRLDELEDVDAHQLDLLLPRKGEQRLLPMLSPTGCDPT